MLYSTPKLPPPRPGLGGTDRVVSKERWSNGLVSGSEMTLRLLIRLEMTSGPAVGTFSRAAAEEGAAGPSGRDLRLESRNRGKGRSDCFSECIESRSIEGCVWWQSELSDFGSRFEASLCSGSSCPFAEFTTCWLSLYCRCC